MTRLAGSGALAMVLLAAACGSGASKAAPDAGPGAGAGTDAGGGGGGPCVGLPGARRGTVARTVDVGGVSRTFLVHAPAGLDPNAAAPLVFVHHGAGMSGQEMLDITGYGTVADREGFVVAFPDGEPGSLGPWNVGTAVCGAGALATASGDDLGFLDAMIADVGTDQCVDAQHVFVTGFSMGGYFSHHVGCVRSDIAAVAPHSGATHPFTDCVPGPKPVIIFHGTADPLITQSCDYTARQQWVARNGCGAGVDSRPVMGGHCEWSQGCPPHGQVVYCLFDGMGHQWAGGAAGQTFSDPNVASATELTWSFFKSEAW